MLIGCALERDIEARTPHFCESLHLGVDFQAHGNVVIFAIFNNRTNARHIDHYTKKYRFIHNYLCNFKNQLIYFCGMNVRRSALSVLLVSLGFISTSFAEIKVVKYYWDAPAIQYQNRRLYVVFENTDTTKDFYGNATVRCGGEYFGVAQILSIFKGGQDGVFFDDEVPFGGDLVCTSDVVQSSNGATVLNNAPLSLSSDADTDGDGTPNSLDTDDDNDGIPDTVEVSMGTNPLSKDSDGDGVYDKQDPFPLDKGEWADADADGIGDNKDTDDDNDGVSDAQELQLGSNPKSSDTDGDGLSDGYEVQLGTSLNSKDTDGDGLTDKQEVEMGTNPLSRDTDGDGVPDNIDPFPLDKLENKDTDGDGIGNATDTDDDNDGLSDSQEMAIGTDPLKADTDGDGLTDKQEVSLKTNPLSRDTDGDGVPDNLDAFPLDPRYSKDVDGNGIPDEIQSVQNMRIGTPVETPVYWNYGDATATGTFAISPDSTSTVAAIVNAQTGELPLSKKEDDDKDGLSNYDEVMVYKTDPLKADTDGDGLTDKQEVDLKSSPFLVDTDGDGISDKADEYVLDKTNGLTDDDHDGLLAKVEKEYWLDPTTKYTYWIIHDYYMYLLIKYGWILLLILLAMYLYWRHRRKESRLLAADKKRREREDRYRKELENRKKVG